MGLNFNVQLLIDNTADGNPTVINLPDLGNSTIRQVMSPLIEKTEEGYLPSCGDLPIDVGTQAHTRLLELHQDLRKEEEELGDRLEETMGDTSSDSWDVLYRQYKEATNFSDRVGVSLNAIKAAGANPAMQARIIYC